ncbi:MraY family glycosyltransferase [Herbaspirillum lusitanum]|uniref:MraY family glycosyltransferase n=1 Tax=Herbaspirillum lusitanum TaxID=213312 RepID=UPI00030D8FC2|nr:glycosyltransferase [Herbaspirillum lusitanum]
MSSLFISFLISAVMTLLVIRYSSLHDGMLDSDLDGVQKVHVHAVPRIGGLGIFLAVICGSVYSAWRQPDIARSIGLVLVCASVAFGGGIVEDFTKSVSPKRRLLLTMLAALLGFWLLDARIDRIDHFSGSWGLNYTWISLPLTVLAVAGIANAINIIDGFNGLASIVALCMLLSLGYVALQVGDSFVLITALLVAGAVAGFFIWNYPAGLIFMGDGGAYFLGFMLGELAILLVMRNPQVSTWYPALLLIYPCFETVFSAYRRFFLRGQSPGMPDGIHLHSLIFRRLVLWAVGRRDARTLTRRNSLTSPYLWLLSLMAVGPATLLWRHTWALMLCCALFVLSYVWLYSRIIRFKSPRWLILRKKHK